jgi:NAD(P)-dependent dehydrogenase (short-subunit alcohol dehydrogenase family)
MTTKISSQFDVTGFGVIVTGGASGLGLAYGEVLAAHGARVTLIDLNPDAVASQVSRLREGGRFEPFFNQVRDYNASRYVREPGCC